MAGSKELVSAVTNRDLEQVLACLGKGADVHYQNDLALRYAVYLGYIDITEALLKRGANVHADDETPLFVAVKAKDAALMDLLIDKGADVRALLEKRKSSLSREDMDAIAEIKSRAARRAFEKNAEILRDKSRHRKPVLLKPKGP